jgi:hypothetical protein
MGLPFTASLHVLFEKISQPIHEYLPFSGPAIHEEHKLLWECYLSGQMTDAALTREMAADPEFSAAVTNLEKIDRRFDCET